MKDLYDIDGEFDPELARDKLIAASTTTNRDIVRTDVQLITAAALVDIAASLKVLALESAFHMPRLLDATPEADPEPDPETPDFSEPYVRVATLDGALTGTTTGEWGVSELEGWVGVLWDTADEGAPASRVYVSNLVPESMRIVNLVDSAPPLREEGDDDIDEDFDIDAVSGDVVPAADDAADAVKLTSALDALKAKKKKGGK